MGNLARANSESNTHEIVIKRGMSEREAAIYLGIPMNSLRQGRCDGARDGRMPPPPYLKISRKIVYLRDDLDRWLEQFRIELGPP